MSADSRSQLERDYDAGRELGHFEMKKLIKILKAERDSMTFNFKQADKERQELHEKYMNLLPGDE